MVLRSKITQLLFYLLGIAGLLVLWWLATSDPGGALHRFAPGRTAEAFLKQLSNLRYWEAVMETMKRMGIGLGLATVIGMPTGLLTGYFLRANQLTYVPFQFLRMISPLSWTPVAIIIFGIGAGPVYFLITIAAVWPIIINTAAGVNAADRQWAEVARCLGAKDWEVLRYVLFRASLPSILTGIQLALGVAWVVIVPAEMLGVASGLGYMILDFRDINDYASIMAIIITIGLLGLGTDLPLRYSIKHLSLNKK